MAPRKKKAVRRHRRSFTSILMTLVVSRLIFSSLPLNRPHTNDLGLSLTLHNIFHFLVYNLISI